MPDPSLNDAQLEAEIKLVGDLVLAASQHEAALSDDEIDEILGLDPEHGHGPAPGSSATGSGEAGVAPEPPGAAGA